MLVWNAHWKEALNWKLLPSMMMMMMMIWFFLLLLLALEAFSLHHSCQTAQRYILLHSYAHSHSHASIPIKLYVLVCYRTRNSLRCRRSMMWMHNVHILQDKWPEKCCSLPLNASYQALTRRKAAKAFPSGPGFPLQCQDDECPAIRPA